MSVTAAGGFTAAGITAGIKDSGTPDLALVVNTGPRRAAAGVFTSNRVKAAPVLWSEQVVKGGRISAVVLNSGGANACTGPKGFQDTHATAEKAAEVLNQAAPESHSPGEIAVAPQGDGAEPVDAPLPAAGLLADVLEGREDAGRVTGQVGGRRRAHA